MPSRFREGDKVVATDRCPYGTLRGKIGTVSRVPYWADDCFYATFNGDIHEWFLRDAYFDLRDNDTTSVIRKIKQMHSRQKFFQELDSRKTAMV